MIDPKFIVERKNFVEDIKKSFQQRYRQKSLMIFNFGAGFPKGKECLECCEGCTTENCIEPKKRKLIRKEIESRLEHHVCFPEEFDLDVPAIDEKIILREENIDLVIILPESFGSRYEFSNYSQDPQIAPLLRIFVPTKYHPLKVNREEQSILSNGYLIHLTKYGHVYSYKDDRELIEKILLLCESYAHLKYYEELDI